MAERRKRILVAEDDPAIRSMEERILVASGYEVLALADGAEALKAARERGPFDLIVLDVMMPGLSGFDVARALQKDDATRRTPILIATARGEGEDMNEGFGAGATLYLVKPFTTATLLAMVRAALTTP